MRPFLAGAVAQLIERLVRNEEVAGLSPVCSTSLRPAGYGWQASRKQTGISSYSRWRCGGGCPP